jgi:hypothetical protein
MRYLPIFRVEKLEGCCHELIAASQYGGYSQIVLERVRPKKQTASAIV